MLIHNIFVYIYYRVDFFVRFQRVRAAFVLCTSETWRHFPNLRDFRILTILAKRENYSTVRKTRNHGDTEVARSGKVRIQVSGLPLLAAACSPSRYLQLFIRVQTTPPPAFIPGTSCIGATNIMITSLVCPSLTQSPVKPSYRREGAKRRGEKQQTHWLAPKQCCCCWRWRRRQD